jgi:hypothetical protein
MTPESFTRPSEIRIENPDTIRNIAYSVMNLAVTNPDLSAKLQDKVRRMVEKLHNLFNFDYLDRSPYYHALKTSSQKKIFAQSELSDDINTQLQLIQRAITNFINDEILPELDSSVRIPETEYAKFIREQIEYLDVFKRKEIIDVMNNFLISLQREYPNIPMRQIPEAQAIIGGRNIHFGISDPEIVKEIGEKIMQEFRSQLNMVTQVNLTLDSEERS